MKIIHTSVEEMAMRRLLIGFEGENQRATVRIDCASVFAEYPNATPSLIVKPLFADAYPVVVDRNGTNVDWLITSEILSFTGDGEIQLVFYKDEVICKSAITKIRVCRSLTVTGDMPDPVVQWIENANRKLAEVDAQIVELEGMVDTATDAATRAEQSASTASAKAEQAAGSAATATAKATEATNAAGTATAKAAEAALSATQASNSAMSAAESERGATAKAGDATTAAGTATTKATEATEAAQTATEKAGDASASATAAQASATNAASSATAASASETAAKASETAASASATQAAQSAQGASTAAQTATQKAAEATQSATNAAASATNAATSAETASTKAGEAAQSAQAVAETAEQLAESLEQIDQNTQDIAELEERKANIDGYYPDMTVGNAEQLNSSKFVENSEPYTLRTSGGTSDIGNREYVDAVVGGTLAWNQAVRNEASENSTDFADIVTVTDAVEDAAGVKVKLEPVQDLHGYSNPWPAGGGKNKFDCTAVTWKKWQLASNAFKVCADNYPLINVTVNSSDSVTVVASDSYKGIGFEIPSNVSIRVFSQSESVASDIRLFDSYADNATALNGSAVSCTIPAGTSGFVAIRFNSSGTYNLKFQLEDGSSATAWTPYSNICPITGWDGVQVNRTGKNLFDVNHATLNPNVTLTDGEIYMPSPSFQSIWLATRLIPFSGLSGVQYTFSASIKSESANNIGIAIHYTDGTITYGNRSDAASTYITSKATSDSTKIIDGFGFTYQTTNIKFWAKDIQLELGSTATAYEPYAGQTYEVSLPTEAGTVYGGELTVNADGSGSLVVDRASVDLGTLLWTKATSGGIPVFYTELNNAPKKSTFYGICSKYKRKQSVPYQNNTFILYGTEFFSRVGIRDDTHSESDSTTFKAAMSGVQLVYELAEPITYTLTATEIRTLLGTNNIWADTGDLALTYTGTDEHLTLESGKKYLTRISGTDSMLLGSGQEITAAKGTDNVFDLTQMFGTAVADYVYGQGAAFFRKWFPNVVYPYNAGELKHVEGLQRHDMVGFNLVHTVIDGELVNRSNGAFTQNANYARTDYIPVLPGVLYYQRESDEVVSEWAAFYDADKNFISGIVTINNSVFMPPNGAVFYCTTIQIKNRNGICINLFHNGSRNGEYAPYEKHSYPLDSTVILRGIPKVGTNGVYWDGDRYLPDGTVKRRYACLVFDGTEGWKLQSVNDHGIANFLFDLSANYDTEGNALCDKFDAQTSSIASTTTEGFMLSAKQYLYIRISATKASTVEQFKAWLSNNNVSLVYELATPTTETAQPYHSTQWVSDWGTEEFVSTGLVPVGHETRYPANLRDKLQHLPDAASGNGSYLITQTDGQMVLTPFPAPPSTAGNYVLKATVVNGVATYTWEVAT